MNKATWIATGTLLALTISSLTVAAASSDVRVMGTITPLACTPTLSNGGAIDYGMIPHESLSPTSYTVLNVMSVGLSIACEAPAKVAIKASNGRPGTAVTNGGDGGGQADGGAPVYLFGQSHVGVAGLGLDGATKIGGYGIRVEPHRAEADAVVVDSLRAKNTSNPDWVKDDYSGNLYDPYYTRVISWGARGTRLPVAFRTLAGQLNVQAYLNKRSELDLSKPIVLDGLTTLELVYL